MCEGGCDSLASNNGVDCDLCAATETNEVGFIGTDFYLGGAFPVDPLWGSGGYGYNEPPSRPESCWRVVWYPIAWLLYVCPVCPENAWGGLCGYLMGTHTHTDPENVYEGHNSVVEFMRMGWRRRSDLHGQEEWRQQVREFLFSEAARTTPARTTPARTTPVRTTPMRTPTHTASAHMTTMRTNQAAPEDDFEDAPLRSQSFVVGHSHGILIGRQFEKVADRCVDSSFEDYTNNTCWICYGSNRQWDLWLSCRHLFCADCSAKMLVLLMPCPLCRIFSSVVHRGECWHGEN